MDDDDDDERITNIRGDCEGTWYVGTFGTLAMIFLLWNFCYVVLKAPSRIFWFVLFFFIRILPSCLGNVNFTMYVQPGYFSKKVAGYERVRQKKMEQNFLEMKAAGINVPNSLFGNFGLNQSGSGKGNDKEKDIGFVVNGDPDYEPCDGEGRVTSDGDNDDPSESQADQVKGTGPRKKKGCSSAQLLKKSQRTQEDGGSPQGATQAQQLPTSPTEQTDMFCSPHTVVGCVGE
ncbi:hypothetical protein RHGRI_029525 [Rhododendron griersonianum]|uniref:Uncharacterized protein n=1 Tax=Rhododendron griersonianum TaxID=479676 RepID=A0AAV6IJP0_9ERIC|nr:hypothetical protein RHGRI_030968 [Rhododendron griersonianum]KAG5528896.1 hypothetical protein RHGRI_029525 [Rhododendron griersonianum]